MKRIYVSGPMTGLPEFNFPAFNAEAARLAAMGFDVVNPATLNPDTTTTWQQCMRNDIAALVTCDTIAMLPGWEYSSGANLELHIASRVGITIVNAREIVEPAAEEVAA
jgi:hypothetical protein